MLVAICAIAGFVRFISAPLVNAKTNTLNVDRLLCHNLTTFDYPKCIIGNIANLLFCQEPWQLCEYQRIGNLFFGKA